ncbi:MAG TPA: PCRF domain-containing protein [Candidatus Paceibacterota bacterium]|jgi:peptide chain release factor 2|nr:PCRF domain-containing protein [Candidatus Paceibacterota bacterium]
MDKDAQENIAKEIEKLEAQMQEPDFWNNKNKAQAVLKEIAELKDAKGGLGKYDKGNAILTIISGAGGDDAEDFSAMLMKMYNRYIDRMGWTAMLISEHKNDHGGYRNITIEISGKGAYGNLKNESGVHRLVRISPFNAKKLRHTSFSLIEILPKLGKLEEKDIFIPESDLKTEFSKSSGPGGQNVNKRETAVRIVHMPSGISVSASNERSQEQNREQAMTILRAKIFKQAEKDKKSIEESMKIKNTEIEWGSQIRSYVLHPYKMVKDHRTGVETSNTEAVLNGEIDIFVDGEKNI